MGPLSIGEKMRMRPMASNDAWRGAPEGHRLLRGIPFGFVGM